METFITAYIAAVIGFGFGLAIALLWSAFISQDRGSLKVILIIDNNIISQTVVKLTTTQTVTGELQPVDRLGNPTIVEAGTEEFTSSDESVFVVEKDPNFSSVFKIIAKKPGVARLDFKADADRSQGVRMISGFIGVEVQAAEAVGFGVKFNEPQEIPDAPVEPEEPTQPETSGEPTEFGEGNPDSGQENQ